MRVALALCVSALLVGCMSEEARRARHQERAGAYFESQQWAEAKIEFLNWIQLDPENAEAHHKLAETQLQLREFGDALWQYREAVRLAPERLEWRTQLARLYLLARRSEPALEQIEFTLASDPEYVDALILRARAHSLAEAFPQALADLERAIELEPDSLAALTLKAQVLTRAQRYPEAEATLNTLVARHPTPTGYSLLALFLLGRERVGEAEIAYRTALERAEGADARKRARLALANMLLASGQHEKTERELLAARSEAPDDPDLLVALARFYVSTQQRDKAVQILEERAAADPEDPSHLIALARFHQVGGERELALQALDRALAIDPLGEDARVMRAEFLIQERDDAAAMEEGRRILDEVLAANPGSVRGMFTQAKLWLVERRYEEAANLLRQVIEEQPQAAAHMLLGNAYLNLGHEDLARGEFLAALQADTTNVPARMQLAALYLKSGSRELAAQEARRGLALQPQHPQLSLILAEALIGLREAAEAKQILASLPLSSDELPRGLRLRAIGSYLRLGEVEPAREISNQLLEERPDAAEVLSVVIAIEARAGRPLDALPKLRAALEHSPDDARLYRLRGGFYLGFRKKQDGAPLFASEAEADLLTALEKDPQSPEGHVLIGKLREYLGRTDEALEHYQTAIARDPKAGEAYLRAGSLYEREKRYSEAIHSYRTLLEETDRGGLSERQLAVAMNNLAWLLADSGSPTREELDRALELAQDALALLPGDPSVADTLGWVMLKRRIPSAAIPHFRDAIESYREGSAARALTRYHLALSYEAAGETEKAIRELEMSLAEAAEFPEREQAERALQRLQPS